MIPRLKTAYDKEIITKLMSKLSVKNKHEVPRFDKIILNMHALMIREAHDCMRTQFPKDKCMLVNMNVQTRKRKRSLH